MFHRFSVTPGKTRRQTKAAIQKNQEKNPASPAHKVLSLAKRKKSIRACERCRLHRIKCSEQKPCGRCVSSKARCIVSYGACSSPQTNNGSDRRSGSDRCENASPSGSAADNRPPYGVPDEIFDLAHIRGFFAGEDSAFSRRSASSARCVFPHIPHAAVPSPGRPPVLNALPKTQRSYYLRLFRDTCHPLLQLISETDFVDLDALPSHGSISDGYSTRNALVDIILALGIQQSHTTGLAGRILGLRQPPSPQSQDAGPSPEATWPGFEYFNRCRECMNMNTNVTLETLRCHALMATYLMKSNAFQDAYILLGVAIRKAYVAKIHRLPPSHLPEFEKTARMQLWWTILSLDLQCSLQLDVPGASAKAVARCPTPTEHDLVSYFSPSSHHEGPVSPYMYTMWLFRLVAVVSDITACFSSADLDEDDSNNPNTLERHTFKLSSSLRDLDAWHSQLPSFLRLGQVRNASDDAEGLDFDGSLTHPVWLQRQRVLLELHYRNAHVLIQRSFIRLRYQPSSVNPSGIISAPGLDFWQSQTDTHANGALHHANTVVDIVFTVCSTSEIFYGWSEILQPLWNATLTIVAHVYANPLNSEVPHALNSLKRAHAVIESFPSTLPSIRSIKSVVHTLATSIQSVAAQGRSPARGP
ncbi:hypothetical protein H2204_006393 [Knufia peltigerae]|uniref:Zn(2)-C6 fungal-type domain-containing protein n=1 Tax=Knufia peltigerae TaxID=1002370 RepID=A0AA38Y419_9EURO|nr:hypothetical protein H2204_006393 [Knufia peltigerae]